MTNEQPLQKFRIRVWCKTCDGDLAGCFGGMPVLRDETYATVAEAEVAGWAFIDGAPYDFEVTNERGDPIT